MDRSKYSVRFADYRWIPRVDIVNVRDRGALGGRPRVVRSFYGFTRAQAVRRALEWRQGR